MAGRGAVERPGVTGTAVHDFLTHVSGRPEISLVHREQVAVWWAGHCG